MTRYLWSFLMAVTLALVPLGALRAQDTQSANDTTFPERINAQNPYAQTLQDAKQSYQDAHRHYQEAYSRASWSWAYYQAYYRAYYDLWTAYSRYVYYLRVYWWSERSISFAGRVVSSDYISIAIYPPPPAPGIAGAVVELTTYVPPGQRRAIHLIGTRTTDATGRFRFDGVAEGTYAYTVRKPGYANASGTVEVRRDLPSQEIRLRKQRGLSGVVLVRPQYGNVPSDPPPGFFDPRPVAGARVSVYRTDVVYIRAPGPTATAVTDANGRFQFDDVDYTSARVSIELANHTTHYENVTLSSGPVELRVVLQYSGPPVPVANRDISGDDIIRR